MVLVSSPGGRPKLPLPKYTIAPSVARRFASFVAVPAPISARRVGIELDGTDFVRRVDLVTARLPPPTNQNLRDWGADRLAAAAVLVATASGCCGYLVLWLIFR